MSIGPVYWMWGALTPLTPPPPPGPPPPARPVPPRNAWLRHATETRRAHQWEIDRLVDGVREYKSPAHAPRLTYWLGTHGTVWGFGLTNQQKTEHFLPCFWHRLFLENCSMSSFVGRPGRNLTVLIQNLSHCHIGCEQFWHLFSII